MLRRTKDEHGGVILTTNKAICEQKATKMMKPSSRDLFESINSIYNATHMMRVMRVNKTRGLTHVNLLVKDVMEKSILSFKLMDGPMTMDKTRRMVAGLTT